MGDTHTQLCSRRKREKSEERKARKAEKKRARDEEEARRVAELSVYSATDNPFHDVNLDQQFRWHKKNEKERKQGPLIPSRDRPTRYLFLLEFVKIVVAFNALLHYCC